MPGGRSTETAGGVTAGGGGVGAERATQPVGRRAVPLSAFRGHGDEGETTAGMRLLDVLEAQLLRDGQESTVVVAARSRGVPDTARGGDPVDGFVEQPFEGELGAASGRGLSDE